MNFNITVTSDYHFNDYLQHASYARFALVVAAGTSIAACLMDSMEISDESSVKNAIKATQIVTSAYMFGSFILINYNGLKETVSYLWRNVSQVQVPNNEMRAANNLLG